MADGTLTIAIALDDAAFKQGVASAKAELDALEAYALSVAASVEAAIAGASASAQALSTGSNTTKSAALARSNIKEALYES